MAGPTRISQLTDGSPVQPTDQVPVARGSGATGYTYKVNAGRIVSDLLNVQNTSTVDLTFDTSTRTLCAAANIPDSSVNVVDSPTIDLDWNSTTRTLSADVSTAVKNASAFNVVDSPTIDLDWNASTRTLSAAITSTLTTMITSSLSSAPFSAKAWVNFTGTGTTPLILRSLNVTSIGRNTAGIRPSAAGSYIINFAPNTFKTTNYCVVGIAKANFTGSNDRAVWLNMNYGSDYKTLNSAIIDTFHDTVAASTPPVPSQADALELNLVFFE